MKGKKKDKHYLCVKQQLKRLTKEEYLILRELCHAAKTSTTRAYTVFVSISSRRKNIFLTPKTIISLKTAKTISC
ncbi:hypothetical protein [Anaerostipes faecalis]|uniref:hypothetical protein n=1 Tax=Anaerostipes faecalis TaxID=2738446 RepID=UPI001C1DF219|nr:hypothetical protein [Anaerostipes faecalis]